MGQMADLASLRARFSVPAIVGAVLLAGSVVTYFAWHVSAQQERQRRENAFRHYVVQARTAVNARFDSYATVVRAAQGLFRASDEVTRAEWRAFSRSLALARRYRGLHSLFYIRYVPAARWLDFLVGVRRSGLANFSLKPPGTRAFYCPIVYSQPDSAAPDIGFDACSTPRGLTVLAAARDLDRVRLSAPINLPDARGQLHRGVVLIAPVYRHGVPLDNAATRRQALQGWVGVSLPADLIMEGVIPPGAPVALDIFDGEDSVGAEPLYRATSAAGRPVPGIGAFRLPVTLTLDGRRWNLLFTDLSVPGQEPLRMLAVGGIITLLIALLVFNLGRTRQRALALAARMTRELTEKEKLLSSIAGNITEGIYRSLAAKGLSYVNDALVRMFGYASVEELLSVPGERLYRDPRRRQQLGALLEQRGFYRNEEVEYRRKDGSLFIGANSAVAVRDERGALLYFDGVISDITERKQAEQKIYQLAHYDSLTGLPNRTLLQDRLAQAVREAHRGERHLALLFLDLDRFKNVNDSLGHEFGDQLLKAVAKRLRECVRESDTVSRQGGDEFLLLLHDIADGTAAARIAEKILQVVSEPYVLGVHELHITPSIGISLYPQDGDNADALIRNADAAMYHAKESGRANYQFYTRDMHISAYERMSLENNLRLALERGEFCLHYQPQVELASGRVVGVEALIRWQHPANELVPPTQFIPVAEQSGLIVAIGEWVLRTACRQNRAWQDAGLPALPVAVNLSAIQLRRRDIDRLVAEVLAETGLDARYLELELTESAVMHDSGETGTMLKRLNVMGVRVAIDDFGTGYSSLGYLKRFKIHRLKIDQTFVQDVAEDTDDAAITSAIISLGRSLKVQTLAEGVETREQLAFLQERGCDQIQGYYFSRPLPPEELAELLRSGRKLEPEA